MIKIKVTKKDEKSDIICVISIPFNPKEVTISSTGINMRPCLVVPVIVAGIVFLVVCKNMFTEMLQPIVAKERL